MAAKKKFQHPDNSFYGYQYGTVFNNGGQEFGFLQSTETPLLYFRGNARVAGMIRPIPARPLDMRSLRAVVDGLGGVQAGNIQLQPLVNEVGG